MDWWKESKFRMIQNNLRDIDGGMDADTEITMLKHFHANVLQIGCGGITAFSDTKLDVQKKSMYLKGDKFGELLHKCHDNGIRVIARFDLSKVDASFETAHPEWLQRTAEGKTVHYNDTVVTCVNGAYQQEESVRIISEVLKNYPVDGIFFNMFGYQTVDYSGNYIGICQCESCRKRFREMYGMELPKDENPENPAYRHYADFKEKTVNLLLEKIQETAKRVRPESAVSTYFDKGMDIIRCETNTAVERPLPLWIYSASDNVSAIEGTFADKVSSNCAINAVDLPFRFMGVSDSFNRIRLCQNMANGGNLDWCIIGSFEDYPDRSNYDGVEEIFAFHERYQEIFDRLHSSAKVLLLRPNPPYIMRGDSMEYRGIFKALKESHVQFDTMIDLDTEEYRNQIDEYQLIIVPGIAQLKSKKLRSALLGTKAKILATAGAFSEDPEFLQQRLGLQKAERRKVTRAAYMETTPKDIFTSFPDQDWVYLDQEYWETGICVSKDDMSDACPRGIMPMLSASTFGPPERCYGHQMTDEAGIVLCKQGAYIPWKIGTLYYNHGYEAFKKVLMDIMKVLVPEKTLKPFETDAHSSMEMLWTEVDDKTACLHLINLSGYNGVTVTPPIEQENIHIQLPAAAKSIERMTRDGLEPTAFDKNTFTTGKCGIYTAYVIRF